MVEEQGVEDSPGTRKTQTGTGSRPRQREDLDPPPSSDSFEPTDLRRDLRRPYAFPVSSDPPFEPPMKVNKAKSARFSEETAGPLPYKSRVNPPQGTKPTGQYDQLVGAFQSSMKELSSMMDQRFRQMNSQLYQMERRLDRAGKRVESVEDKQDAEEETSERLPEAKRSFIHPPSSVAVNTQTVANVEIQASESSIPATKPVKVPSLAPVLREPEPILTKNIESQTPVDRSESVQEDMIDQLTSVWLETLELLKTGNLRAAYAKILATGDDIYLLRLIHKTGVCLKELDVTTGMTVVRRLGQIMHSNFLENLGLQWIEETVQKGVFYQLPSDIQKGLIQALYTISALPTDEGVAAAQLYSYLTSSSA